MIALAASSHSLDGLFGAITQIVPPVRTDTRWSEILETLKSGFEIRGPAGGGGWAREFDWLFDARDAALHAEESFQATVPHPTGTNASPEHVRYSLECAIRAVSLLLEVLEICVAHPRTELAQWAIDFRPAVERLRASRTPRLELLEPR